MLKRFNQEGGVIPVLVLLAAIGIIALIFISGTFNFRDNLFNKLFPKPPSHAQESQAPSIPDEILLKFKPGASQKAKNTTMKQYGLKEKQTIGKIDVIIAKVPEKAKDRVIQALSHNPNIEHAEPNYISQLLLSPNDPIYNPNGQSGLFNINAPAAWDISTGSVTTVVAVVDSGLDSDHPDLVGKAVSGASFVDYTNSTEDDHGHGTSVSGIFGAKTDNNIGIASLGWNTMIMPLKACINTGSCGDGNVINAIIYAADHGAKVINLSLGAGDANTGVGYSQIYQEAINYAWSKGVVISAAAGNAGGVGGVGIVYPAAYAHVIAVGASNPDNTRAQLSSYGNGLDVVAPGTSQYTTKIGGSYGSLGGTSFSTPFVSGLASLILAANPNLTPQQVTDIITSTAYKDARYTFDSNGWNPEVGYGVIRADAALQKALQVTPAPTETPTPTPTPSPTPVVTDTTQPTVSMTSPVANQTVSGTFTFTADASDNISVSGVTFLVDGQNFIGEDVSAPYQTSLDTTGLTNGSHTVYATAADPSSNLGQSTTVSFTVDNTTQQPTPTPTPQPSPTAVPTITTSSDTIQPTVAISSPTNGELVASRSRITISASVSDNVGISKVEFYVGSTLLCTDMISSYNCQWNVPGKKNTQYTITAKAYDLSGNSSSSTVTIRTQ